MQLNHEQQEAVDTIQGPLLIVAGAGSGKTSVLTHRIGNMIQQNIAPWNILAVTFTNKAAAEMRERISKQVGQKQAKDIWMMTFHSMCSRILRYEGASLSFLGGKMGPNFTIYDTGDAKSVMKQVILELGYDVKKVTPQGMLHYVSTLKNEMIDVQTFLHMKPSNKWIDWKKAEALINDTIPEEKRAQVALVYEKYQERLRLNNAIDFDDLILHTIALFMQYPAILDRYQEKFRYILVDEYQDTNHAQYVLIKMLAGKHQNIAVVGDDSQSIYKFRGADIRNILEFEKDYPTTKVIKLEENFRCTPVILEAANQVIARNAIQRKKTLFTKKEKGEKISYYLAFDERDEARYVTNEVQRLLRNGYNYKDIAILFRANSQSRAFEEAFMRAGFPYQLVGAFKFFQRMEILDLLSYLKFIENPNDLVAFSRIINNPRRGIGKKTVEQLMANAKGDFLAYLKNPTDVKLTKNARNGLDGFVQLIETYRTNKENRSLSELLNGLIMDSGYINALKLSKDEKSEERIENVSELINMAIEMENEEEEATLQSFLEQASLHSAQDDQTDDNAIRLMTLHSAKGLEFPAVFLVGMEEGIFPHKRSASQEDVEEERRLCYVGITRAKEKLFMTHAKRRNVWGKSDENPPSRFLYEFDENLVDSNDLLRRNW